MNNSPCNNFPLGNNNDDDNNLDGFTAQVLFDSACNSEFR